MILFKKILIFFLFVRSYSDMTNEKSDFLVENDGFDVQEKNL